MRLTGSLWTTVTQGTSGSGTSIGASLASGRSISTGLTLTPPMLPPGGGGRLNRHPYLVTLTSMRGNIINMDTADLGLPVDVPSTALFTDRYELTMLQAALRAGTADRRSVLQVFTRRPPEGRRSGVVAG